MRSIALFRWMGSLSRIDVVVGPTPSESPLSPSTFLVLTHFLPSTVSDSLATSLPVPILTVVLPFFSEVITAFARLFCMRLQNQTKANDQKGNEVFHTASVQKNGGSCEIRTHGGLTSSPVFKTGALNRSAKLPWVDILTVLQQSLGLNKRNYLCQATQSL